MNPTIQFFIPMEPVAKARARKGLYTWYTPQKTRRAEEFIRVQADRYKPPEPYRHVRITMFFHMPMPKSMTKKEKSFLRMITSVVMPHLKKPDLDNMEKLIMDALQGTFWTNDSVIWHKETKKIYAEDNEPGIAVLIQGE